MTPRHDHIAPPADYALTNLYDGESECLEDMGLGSWAMPSARAATPSGLSRPASSCQHRIAIAFLLARSTAMRFGSNRALIALGSDGGLDSRRQVVPAGTARRHRDGVGASAAARLPGVVALAPAAVPLPDSGILARVAICARRSRSRGTVARKATDLLACAFITDVRNNPHLALICAAAGVLAGMLAVLVPAIVVAGVIR